jgi:uncharacterized protein YndB with AHSA1/START domain
MERGTLTEHEGRPAVRFERHYRHSAQRVWAAITEPDELAHWFPSAVRMSAEVGGAIEFTEDPNVAPGTGTILAYQPPHRLAYSWGGDELHFDLVEDGAGGCVLTMVHVLAARDTAARTAAGWTICLAELDKQLAGENPAGPHSADAQPWRPVYDEYVAAGMPSGAPIPGMTD